MNLDRRSVLKGIAAAGASLTFAGYAGAAGTRQYIVVGGGQSRLERAGFEVKQVLAEGDVFVVAGAEDAVEEIEQVGGVQGAAPNVRFELERPKLEEVAPEEDLEEPTFYDRYLWDKQVTESLEANQTATGDGSKIAIIDTGTDYRHPDLTPNLDKEAGRRFKNGSIDSGTEDDIVVGRPAPEESDLDFDIDFVEQNVADDVEGHGTHVAGIAGASADEGALGTGVAGTAPEVDLAAFRVFWWIKVGTDDDPVDERWAPTTTSADILTAIDYGASKDYDAVNLSLGTPPLPPQVNSDPVVKAYKKVIQSAVSRGTVVAASAGNANTDLQRGGTFSLPNSIEGAMSISATAPNDKRAFYSNFGTNEIDVGAPGGGYETLEKTLATGGVEWPFPFNLVFSTISPRVEGAAYGWKAGTSMAAPQVAGLTALVRELDPRASARRVESEIKLGAEGSAGRSSPDLGAGRINALNTVERVDGRGGSGGGNGKGGPP
ncbi:MAG: S8 family serine peptidase [Haloarculaceae archaeon]